MNLSCYSTTVDHNVAMIEELRADPDYANAYLANALEEINEPGGLGGFFCCVTPGNLALPIRVIDRIIPENDMYYYTILISQGERRLY